MGASRTLLYLLGYALLVLGLALAADLLGLAEPWIIVLVIVLAGAGLMGVSRRGER